MEKTAFSPADILLPHDCGLTKWAVVACDQYTSQPEYWERVDQYVGDAPSTLRLILPESKFESDNVDEEIQKINATMEQYLQEERLRPVEDAMIFVERKLANGKTRLGLLGKLDLEEYSYEKGSGTPIRATEGTVLSRIPPRVAVRMVAELAMGMQAGSDAGLPLPLLGALAGFTGVCIVWQNAAVLRDCGIGMRALLPVKLLHALFCFALCLPASAIPGPAQAVFAPAQRPATVLLPNSAAALTLLALAIGGNLWYNRKRTL